MMPGDASFDTALGLEFLAEPFAEFLLLAREIFAGESTRIPVRVSSMWIPGEPRKFDCFPRPVGFGPRGLREG